MKLKRLTFSILAITCLGLASCSSGPAPNTKTGAVLGGLLGAGTGAVIGNQSGRALEGAAIGGAAGAAGGALLGSAADDRERMRRRDAEVRSQDDYYRGYNRGQYDRRY